MIPAGWWAGGARARARRQRILGGVLALSLGLAGCGSPASPDLSNTPTPIRSSAAGAASPAAVEPGSTASPVAVEPGSAASPDPSAVAGTPAAGTQPQMAPGRAGAAALPASRGGLPLTGGDWPMYGHDNSRTNYNPAETALGLATVPQLAPRWQVDIGTDGTPPSGAPSVANGRVYIGSSVGDGANFFALDALSGAVAWKATVGHNPTCFNVGIGATSAISGNLVVAGGDDAAYYGLDAATGALRWRTPLDVPGAFAWASPALAGGLAYVGVASGCDHPPVRGAVEALSLDDGDVLEDEAFVPAGQMGAGIWNSPALSPDGQTLVVATGEDSGGYNGPYNRAMVALDPRTLTIRAANQQGPLNGDKDYATTPVVFTDSRHRTLVAAHHKDENFYAYDLQHLAAGPIWQRHTGAIIGMMPAYDPTMGDGGTLFFLDGLGHLTAVDPATGQDRWAPLPVGTPRGNMAIANGLLFLNAGEQGLVVVDERLGQILTTLKPAHAGKTYSGVAVAHGFVYWLSGSWLNAWSVPGAGS